MPGLTDEKLVTSGNPSLLLEIGETGTIVNLDIVNTVWISTVPAFAASDGQGIAPLGPLNTMSFNGTTPVYAVAAPGTAVNVAILPYATQWSPSPAQSAAQIAALGLATLTAQNTQIGQLTSTPANYIAKEVAALIASGSVGGTPGGTPLLHGVKALLTAQTFAVPGAGELNSGNLTVSKPGYVISVKNSYSGSPTAPFMLVRMVWRDPSAVAHVGYEEWLLPASSIADYEIIGRGPTKSSIVEMFFDNQDPAVTITSTVTLLETTHHMARDDWRSLFLDVVAGFTSAPGAALARNILMNDVALALAVGSSQSYLLPVYAGQAWLAVEATGGTGNVVQVVIYPLTLSLTTPASNAAVFYQQFTIPASGAVQSGDLTITLPRVPCVIVISSIGSSGSTNSNISLTALEYAS